ncbi:hypothetical protein NE237_023949 [Protea cynaroides]|uniref:Uncharacterized protein n=1 Tax=Protea cynaroides TaxID=273540 RepID=A0A9Q0K6I6_9MAGN|nr:hypothetical protein NE237_023949 [Protea cynaroides]
MEEISDHAYSGSHLSNHHHGSLLDKSNCNSHREGKIYGKRSSRGPELSLLLRPPLKHLHCLVQGGLTFSVSRSIRLYRGVAEEEAEEESVSSSSESFSRGVVWFRSEVRSILSHIFSIP